MTTSNPRITVTLAPAVSAVLSEISRLSGNSKSSIVGDLLLQALPVFDRMAKVMQSVAMAKQQGDKATELAREEMKGSLERAQGRIEKELGLLDELTEEMDLLAAAEKINRRAVGTRRPTDGTAAPRSPLSTPVSNRGVTPLQQHRKQAKRTKAGTQ